MPIIDNLLYLLPPLVITSHLLLAPYTKVEESFSLQATHDILHFGIPTENISTTLTSDYDHLTFPGAVPRSFVGPLLLSQASTPLLRALHRYVDEQTIVRFTLGLATSLALNFLISRVRRTYGSTTSRFYTILQLTQFHLPFYASRPLPNTFALIPTLLATGLLLPNPLSYTKTINSFKLAIVVLAASAVIFRCEIALLLFWTVLQLFIQRQLSIRQIITSGIAGVIVGLSATLSVDSYFWLSYTKAPIFTTPLLTEHTGLIWPELSTFLFNFISGHASEWGVSPWHYYFTNSLPKLLLNPVSLLTLPLGIRQHPGLLNPAFLFAAVYSVLPHKEWRFIIYILPTLTLASALGATRIWNQRWKSVVYKLLATAVIASIPASALLAGGMGWISSLNYPGGQALARLSAHLHQGDTVWLDTETCMTGASRFLQTPGVVWDKNEAPQKPPGFWDNLDWALVADRGSLGGRWSTVEAIRGYGGIELKRIAGVPVPKINMVEKIWIMKKVHGQNVEDPNPVETTPPVEAQEPIEFKRAVEDERPTEPVVERPTQIEPPVEPVAEQKVDAERLVEVERPVEVDLPVEVEQPLEVDRSPEVEQPVEPVVQPPVEVQQPVEVERPVEPVEVERPVEPVGVERPVEPVEVERPVEPVEVERPVEPVEVERPAEPVEVKRPAEPVEASHSVEASQPVENALPVQPSEVERSPEVTPSVVTQVIEVERLVESPQPVEPVGFEPPATAAEQPVEVQTPVDPVEFEPPATAAEQPIEVQTPVEPEVQRPVEVQQPVEAETTAEVDRPVEPAAKQPVENERPGEVELPVEPAVEQTREPERFVEAHQPIPDEPVVELERPAEVEPPVEVERPVEPVEPVETVETVEPTEPVNPVETIEPVEPVEIERLVQTMVEQPGELERPVDVESPAEIELPVEPASEHSTEEKRPMESVGNSQHVENTRPTEAFQQADFAPPSLPPASISQPASSSPPVSAPQPHF